MQADAEPEARRTCRERRGGDASDTVHRPILFLTDNASSHTVMHSAMYGIPRMTFHRMPSSCLFPAGLLSLHSCSHRNLTHASQCLLGRTKEGLLSYSWDRVCGEAWDKAKHCSWSLSFVVGWDMLPRGYKTNKQTKKNWVPCQFAFG